MNSAQHGCKPLIWNLFSKLRTDSLYNFPRWSKFTAEAKLVTLNVVSSFSAGLSQWQAFPNHADPALCHKHPRAPPVTDPLKWKPNTSLGRNIISTGEVNGHQCVHFLQVPLLLTPASRDHGSTAQPEWEADWIFQSSHFQRRQTKNNSISCHGFKKSSLVIQRGASPSLRRKNLAPAFLPAHPFLTEKEHLWVDRDTKASQ